MIKRLVSTLRKRIHERRRYNAILAEIATLDSRDLDDIGTDRTELVRGARRAVYG